MQKGPTKVLTAFRLWSPRYTAIFGIILYRDNGKEHGNYYLGFRV